MRRWLKQVLASAALLVKSYASAHEFLEDKLPEQPACLLLDEELPGMNGVELLQLLRGRGQSLATVMITDNAKVPRAVEVLKLGAHDYLEKPLHLESLLLTIQSAIAASTKSLFMDASRSKIEQRLQALTARERQVMNLLAAGRHTKSIASELGVSTKTVEHHRPRILEKLRVDNVVELAHLVLMSRSSQTLQFRPHFLDAAHNHTLSNDYAKS